MLRLNGFPYHLVPEVPNQFPRARFQDIPRNTEYDEKPEECQQEIRPPKRAAKKVAQVVVATRLP